MSERPERADTWYEPLLRPTVAGHGLPADSRRGTTTVDAPDDRCLPHPYLDAPTKASESWYKRYKAGFEAYSAELLRQGWEPSTGSFWGDVRVLWVLRGTRRPKGWSEEDFNAELLRHGCDPPSGSLWEILLGHLISEQGAVYLGKLQDEARAMKKVQKEQKAQDVQMARDKMQKERVDSGGRSTDTWIGNLRHACSGVLVRKSRRLAPAPPAASEGRTFCSQPQIVPFGGNTERWPRSSGAARAEA